jgi:hypothetical protein
VVSKRANQDRKQRIESDKLIPQFSSTHVYEHNNSISFFGFIALIKSGYAGVLSYIPFLFFIALIKSGYPILTGIGSTWTMVCSGKIW